MVYEPINGTLPVPKKRGFKKKYLLVMLLLASITAGAITIIVLFTTTNLFSNRNPANTVLTAINGLNARRYDSQRTKLNGGVVCEDFAADAKLGAQQRNYKVLTSTYKQTDGATVTISGDEAYDQALALGRAVVPVEVQYYGNTQKWADVGTKFLCAITAQKFVTNSEQLVAVPAGTKQSLLDDPTVFPIDNVQVSQPAEVSSRLFKDVNQVAGFYDFLFNYFNHGPEIMELTTIAFDPLVRGSTTLGDYRAPARALQIKVSVGELALLDKPPIKVSTVSDEEWLLARRVNAIWPVLSHEYGHHLVEVYAKRMPVNASERVLPSMMSYTQNVDPDCGKIATAIKLPVGSTAALYCDSSVFNYGLMDGILTNSGYSSINTVKKVNFGAGYPSTETFAKAADFPIDYNTTVFAGKNSSFDYVISNTVWDKSNVPSALLGAYILNSYRFSYDEIMARLYNISSAPNMNNRSSYRQTQNTSTNFEQEYELHGEINTNEFPTTEPMIEDDTSDQARLVEISKLFEQMRASGAPVSYTGGSGFVDQPLTRTIYGTSPNKEKYMVLKDSFNQYTTVALDYGRTAVANETGVMLPTIKIDNSMQLVKPNASSSHDYNEVYEWDSAPLTYKSSRAYGEMFQRDPNNEKTYFASFDASLADALVGKSVVGFTNTRINAASLLPPTMSPLTLDGSIYTKAFFQTAETDRFLLPVNATGTIKRLTKIEGDTLFFQNLRDSFVVRVDIPTKSITFGSRNLESL